MSSVPTQFTDSTGNISAPVFTFPGGADDPTVLAQGIFVEADKHLIQSAAFQTSSGTSSYEIWVYIFVLEFNRMYRGSVLRLIHAEMEQYKQLMLKNVMIVITDTFGFGEFSISEIKKFDDTSTKSIVSLSVAILLVSSCSFILVLAISHYLSNISEENEHEKLGEFSAGLKKQRKARFYTPLLVFRRILLCSWLIIFSHQSSTVLVSVMLATQFVYFAVLIYINAFEEKQNALVEYINEAFFIFLIVYLLKYNSESRWKSTPKNVYLYIMMSNNGIIVLILCTCSAFSLISKLSCKPSRSKKIMNPINSRAPNIPSATKFKVTEISSSNIHMHSPHRYSLNRSPKLAAPRQGANKKAKIQPVQF